MTRLPHNQQQTPLLTCRLAAFSARLWTLRYPHADLILPRVSINTAVWPHNQIFQCCFPIAKSRPYLQARTLEITKAVVHFEEVARDSPLDAKAHHNLAAAYHKAKRLHDAQQVTGHRGHIV